MTFACRTAPEGFVFEKLDPQKHTASGFSCGVEALDVFLRTRAARDQERNLSTSWVLLEGTGPGSPIVAYMTLVAIEIPVASAPKAITKISKRSSLPAMLLARMAVDTRFHRRRLGEFLLSAAFDGALQMATLGGCIAIVVDAKDDRVKSFYTKYGFDAFPERPSRLFLLTATLQKAQHVE